MKNDTKLIPKRIKEAREYRFLSMEELADKIGKTRQAISQFENGINKPSPDILSKIAMETGFPINYFFKPEHIKVAAATEIPIYRGSASKTKALKKSYQIAAEWSYDVVDYLKHYVELLDVNVPNYEFDFTSNIDLIRRIENIANQLRRYWSLGKGPIRDIVGILENNGFIVSKIPNKAKEVEAFSLWYEKVPHIFYEGNRDTPVSYTFSICHELGHLILHQGLTEKEISDAVFMKEIEKQANLFAGSFLMPDESFGNEYLASNLEPFISIKKKWNVSISAMIMRANVLGIIDKNQKGYLFKQLSSRGYRQHEPYDDDIEFEGPSLIFNSIRLILDRGIVKLADFIETIAIPVNDLSAICSFPDDFISKNLSVHRNAPHLRLIK